MTRLLFARIFLGTKRWAKPSVAALDGTNEVALAVIAVTLCILAVFGPIAFLSGVVGQFFKSFGLGVCFVMIISLFDALSNAPMLSAYFGGKHTSVQSQTGFFSQSLKAFDKFQTKLENYYESKLKIILRHPIPTALATFVLVILLGVTVVFIPKTFLPLKKTVNLRLHLNFHAEPSFKT